MGKIFVFIGPSASGKDTIYKTIKEDFPELLPIITYTTRPIRENEIDGEEYHFISKEKMDEMEKNSELIERRNYDVKKYGIWSYATSKSSLNLNNNNYITINTLEGFNRFKYFYQEKVIPIYIFVDDETRLQRAIDREALQKNPKYDELKRRFEADSKDFSKEKIDEAGITKFYHNNNLYTCIYDIEKDIDKILNANKKKKF